MDHLLIAAAGNETPFTVTFPAEKILFIIVLGDTTKNVRPKTCKPT